MIFKVRIIKNTKGFTKGNEYPVLHIINEEVEQIKPIRNEVKENKHHDYDDEEFIMEKENENVRYISISILWLLIPDDKGRLKWVDSMNVRYISN